MIEEYFLLAGSGTLAKYKGYQLDEDIFPELGELPEPPRVNPEIRFDFYVVRSSDVLLKDLDRTINFDNSS